MTKNDMEQENQELKLIVAELWEALTDDNDECPMAICEHMLECNGTQQCFYVRKMREFGINDE